MLPTFSSSPASTPPFSLLAESDIESALTTALELFKRDRNWNDGAAKKLCMQIFTALGDSHPTTKAGRRRLSNLMFV